MTTPQDMTKAISTTQVAKVRREASSITSPVLNTASAIVIADPTGYELADQCLKRIREARTQVTAKFEPIITPLRASLDAIYAFRRELEDPLELAEKQIKGKMSSWQISERKRIQAETDAKEEEARVLAQQIAEKTARANAATRQSVRTALTNSTTEMTRQLIEVESKPVSAPPKAGNSRTRTVTKCAVIDLRAFFAAVAAGQIPMDMICVNDDALNSAFRTDKDTVSAWPGVTVTTDIIIVGR